MPWTESSIVGTLLGVQAHRQHRRSLLPGLRKGKVSHHELAARLSLQNGWGGEEMEFQRGMCSSEDVEKVRGKDPPS